MVAPMSKVIQIRDRDVDKINELVDDPNDELTWAEKVNEIVNKATAWEERGSDVL